MLHSLVSTYNSYLAYSTIVEGRKIFAHRNVLASRCKYFHSMFLGPLKESELQEIPINEVAYSAFLCFMNYLYTEDINVDVNEAIDLLEVWNKPIIINIWR
jgi:hypothetical protein